MAAGGGLASCSTRAGPSTSGLASLGDLALVALDARHSVDVRALLLSAVTSIEPGDSERRDERHDQSCSRRNTDHAFDPCVKNPGARAARREKDIPRGRTGGREPDPERLVANATRAKSPSEEKSEVEGPARVEQSARPLAASVPQGNRHAASPHPGARSASVMDFVSFLNSALRILHVPHAGRVIAPAAALQRVPLTGTAGRNRPPPCCSPRADRSRGSGGPARCGCCRWDRHS